MSVFPLGYHGHGAGPTSGLWGQQGGVPGRGDYPLRDDTCYAIELNARTRVPEWEGQEVRVALGPRWLFVIGGMGCLLIAVVWVLSPPLIHVEEEIVRRRAPDTALAGRGRGEGS